MSKLKQPKTKIIFLVTGIISTIWFLIRVIPKPSRAYYPCQRALFPVASSFIIWLLGTVATMFATHKTRKAFHTSRPLKAFVLMGVTLLLFTLTYLILPSESLVAKAFNIIEEKPVLTSDYNILEDDLIAPQAVVSIIKSERSDVTKISKTEIEQMVRDAVNMAGGIDDIVSDGDTVILKVNLVNTLSNETGFTTEANGMVTDWRVASAMAKIVREINTNGIIYIMEGSAGVSTEEAFQTLLYTKENIPEVDDFIAIERTSGEWHNFSDNNLVSATLPAGKKLYDNNGKPDNTNNYYYNKLYFNADAVISLPVLKNHETAGVTGAVKNLGIGATPTNIYGNSDGINGRWNIIAHNGRDLHKFIHDYYYLRPADFALMDGIQGWNNGPALKYGASNFAGHQEGMGVILASENAVALDAIAALIMGDNPREVPYLVYLDNNEKGCANPNAIMVKGTKVYEIKKNFPHEENRTQCTYTDYTAPDVELQNIQYEGNILNISFSNSDQISSVEIKMDDYYIPFIGVRNFESLSVDLSGYPITDSLLTLYVHDEYLNTKVITYEGYPQGTNILDNRNYSITCYPNPVINDLYLELNSSYLGAIEIALYSINGTLVFHEFAYKNSIDFIYNLNLQNQPSGMYIIHIEAGNEYLTYKISKTY